MAKPNVKELVVNHFEKGIFAVACLLAVVTLAGTRWLPYGHHPSEITQKVKQADGKIDAKTWPDDEQQKFVVPKRESVKELVQNNLRVQVDASPYEFDMPFHFGIYQTNKPISEPEHLGIRALIAQSGRFLMGVQPSEDDELTEEDPDQMAAAAEEEDDQSDIPEEFRTRKMKTSQGPDGAAGLGSGGGLGLGAGGGLGLGFGANRGDEYEDNMEAMMAGGDGDMMGDGEMGMGMGMGSNVEGRGLRYVAVRGIIPLREQIRKYMKAINLRSFSRASSLYEIIEFDLQRKKMQPGDDPWGGEWESVDIEIAKDILSEALTFDPEVVSGSITDSAVTMPLPGRLMGIWKSKATHPNLENFTLSPAEMEAELEFNRLLLDQYEEQKQNEPEKVKKGGFSDIVVDSRSMAMGSFDQDYEGGMTDDFDYESEGGGGMGSGMGMGGINYAPTSTGSMTPQAQAFLDKLKKQAGNDPAERDKALLEYIQERVTAQGELLLFRYFDFDVEPGATYTYRARLEVRNPNYGLNIAQVGGLAHIIEGQTRKSDWSNETEPAIVPLDVDYFVSKIDENSSGLAQARMEVFQWNPDYGTTVRDSLEVSFGEEVGGPKDTLVLDPAKNRFEIEKSYQFHTGDVLVDALSQEKIPSNLLREGELHGDLKLPKRPNNPRGSLGLSPQALISKGNEDLAVIDRHSRMNGLARRRELLKYEQEPYEDLKQAEGKAAGMDDMEAYGGEYDMGAGSEGMEGMMGMGALGGGEDYGRGRGSRRGSALRKGSGRGSSGSRSGGSSMR